MGEDDRRRFDAAIARSHGAVIVTGPTGSGKSTTLYSALGGDPEPGEDDHHDRGPGRGPDEGHKQVQVNNKTGLDFAAGLRSMMRADPDVIMVGEIRDKETALTAIESSLTGHLDPVDASHERRPGAVTRLVEMGIEPFLVASSVSCVVGQRLARALCDACKEPYTIPASMLLENGFDVDEDVSAFRPVGCVRCGSTGFRGRLGLFEVMPVTRPIRELILSHSTSEAIGDWAVAEGMRRMSDHGLDHVRAGRTSLEEVLRVTSAA